MATFSQQFLSSLANPAGMLQGAANLGAAIGGVPGQMKEKRFQTDLSAIDTTTYAGQIEAQQKLLSREKDPRVRLQMQSDINSTRKLQKKEESLDAYIAANPGIPIDQQNLLRSGSISVGQSDQMNQKRIKGEAQGELGYTEREELLIAAGWTPNQIEGRRKSGVAAKEQMVAGKGRIKNLGSDAARDYVKSLYPDVKTDAEYYSLIGGLKQADFDDNIQSFANNNFSKGLRGFENKTDKEKTFYSDLADSVDNRVMTIDDARAQIKLFNSGIDITVPVEYENIETGDIVKIVKVNPPPGEGGQYMAKLTGEGNPVRIDINKFKETEAEPKAYTPKYGTVTDQNITSAMNYIETKYDSNEYKDDLPGLLAETANFVQKNSEKSVSYKKSLDIAEKFLKIKAEGGNIVFDAQISRENEDVDFEKLLQQIRSTENDPLGIL